MSGLDSSSSLIDKILNKKTFDTIFYLLSVIILASSIVLAYLPDPYYVQGWVLITSLGGLYFYMALTLLIYFLIDPEIGYQVIVTLISSSWINIVLKTFFALPRPPNPRVKVSGFGFPSGHAQISSTFWTSITLFYRRYSLIIFSIVMVSAISLSRIMLNVHYPFDIVGGVLIGFISAVFFIKRLYSVRLPEKNIKIYRLFLGLAIATLLIITYLICIDDLLILEFSGFLIGFSFHPLIYREKREKHYRLIIKYLIGLGISFISYKYVFSNPIMILAVFTLNGLLIPIIRFRI